MKSKTQILTPHKKEIIKDAYRLLDSPSRRLFGRQVMTLGAISMLTGCSLTDDDSIEESLKIMSRLNDKAQALIFSSNKLAPEYLASQITKPFPFNAFYSEEEIRPSPNNFKLAVSGKVSGQNFPDAAGRPAGGLHLAGVRSRSRAAPDHPETIQSAAAAVDL